MGDSLGSEMELQILRSSVSVLRVAAGVEPYVVATAGINQMLDHLVNYQWSDEEHRIVYECLRKAQQLRIVPLREWLASEATRLGHPDVDWDAYFAQPSERIDVADLVGRFKSTSL